MRFYEVSSLTDQPLSDFDASVKIFCAPVWRTHHFAADCPSPSPSAHRTKGIVHFFTGKEIEGELHRAGFELEAYQREEYGHALGLAAETTR
jgi:hypothetical protein